MLPMLPQCDKVSKVTEQICSGLLACFGRQCWQTLERPNLFRLLLSLLLSSLLLPLQLLLLLLLLGGMHLWLGLLLCRHVYETARTSPSTSAPSSFLLPIAKILHRRLTQKQWARSWISPAHPCC